MNYYSYLENKEHPLLAYINSDLWIECEQLDTGKCYYIRVLEVVDNLMRFNSISSNIVRNANRYDLTPKSFSLIINSIHKDRLDNYEILQPEDAISTEELLDILHIE